MSEQVDLVEIKTEPNEYDELFSICKNTNMVANYSSNDRTTSESKNHTLIKFQLSLQKVIIQLKHYIKFEDIFEHTFCFYFEVIFFI